MLLAGPTGTGETYTLNSVISSIADMEKAGRIPDGSGWRAHSGRR